MQVVLSHLTVRVRAADVVRIAVEAQRAGREHALASRRVDRRLTQQQPPSAPAAAKEAGRWLFAVVADLANGHQRGGDEGGAIAGLPRKQDHAEVGRRRFRALQQHAVQVQYFLLTEA